MEQKTDAGEKSEIAARFPKSEKLCSQKLIEELFKQSSSLFAYPFKVVFLPARPDSPPAFPQVLISVPKKNIRKAFLRNRIKRQIREIYRLHKHKVFVAGRADTPLALSLVFVGKKAESYSFMEKRLVKLLQQIPDKPKSEQNKRTDVPN